MQNNHKLLSFLFLLWIQRNKIIEKRKNEFFLPKCYNEVFFLLIGYVLQLFRQCNTIQMLLFLKSESFAKEEKKKIQIQTNAQSCK